MFTDAEWQQLVLNYTDKQFVAQEYVQISKRQQSFYEDGAIKEKSVYFDLCPHLFIKHGKLL
jgi:hypothetical protein